MSSPQPPTDAEIEALRGYYEAELAQGVDRFLEPRTEACPWCGSAELKRRVRAKDVWQGKPGDFVLDECRTCRHVFQNPRLTIEGLNFYYKDFYDGLGQLRMEARFGGAGEYHRQRAEMVKAELANDGTTPKRWLDVGTGYGHFAKHAREVLPDTVFDGLDMGDSVLIGEGRGWLDTAHQGMFPELAESLAGQYDVASMHHYLEHTREPKAELDAAARLLAPGGLLLIEVPNPSYRFAKAYGRWWLGLGQPQHQHLIPMPNLLQALTDRGFTPVATADGEAHMPLDAAFAFPLVFDLRSSSRAVVGEDALDLAPWLPASGSTRRSRAGRLWTKTVINAGHVVDKVLASVAHRTDDGNAYRVLARRDAT